MLLVVSVVSLAAWIFLLLARGGFWRADIGLSPAAPAGGDWPEVVAVIPARNEAETVQEVLTAHGASDYPGRLSVVLVDDSSSDGTAALAERAAEASPRAIHLVQAPALPAGWTGKLWALETGLRAAEEQAPNASWVLLTDADIVHAPATLRRLVSKARKERADLVSLMARLDDRGFWGGLLVPAFIFFFQKLYPFAWVADPRRKTAAAAGGCVLVRRAALSDIGGIAAIRGALIDDCTLAARVKHGPPARKIWLGLAERAVVSRRDNRSLGSIWTMVARTAFAQLHRSYALLLGTVLGMALLYLAGPAILLSWPWHGSFAAAAAGGASWALMALAYGPTLARYDRPRLAGLALPLAACIYTLMTIDSARRHLMGRGGGWKGRTYAHG